MGRPDLGAFCTVEKPRMLPPTKQQNAIRQVKQVTSTWCSFRLGRAANRCRRSDGAEEPFSGSGRTGHNEGLCPAGCDQIVAD